MHKHCTTKMRKFRCMKFLCIISGCPAGARKWHIFNFAMLLHSKSRKSCRFLETASLLLPPAALRLFPCAIKIYSFQNFCKVLKTGSAG